MTPDVTASFQLFILIRSWFGTLAIGFSRYVSEIDGFEIRDVSIFLLFVIFFSVLLSYL